MNTKNLQCNRHYEVAKSLGKFMSDKNKKYTARPLNKYKPDDMWLLSATTDWPVYKYGKYSFWMKNEIMWIGLYIEKGLGEKLGEVYKSDLIMDKDWIWYQFYEDMSSGKIDEIICELGNAAQQTIHFMIECDFIEDIRDLDYKKKKKGSIYHYVIENDRIKIIEDNKNFITPELDKLRKISSISEIPEVLSKLKECDYMWFDFYIVLPFKTNNTDKDNLNVINEYDLCKNLLDPLNKWV